MIGLYIGIEHQVATLKTEVKVVGDLGAKIEIGANPVRQDMLREERSIGDIHQVED